MQIVGADPEIFEELEKRLFLLRDELRIMFTGLTIEGEVGYGDLMECIEDDDAQELIKHENLLLVIGNSGTGAAGSWIGGHVVNLLREAPLPVLAVPADCTFQPWQHAVLTCDYREEEREGETYELLHELLPKTARLSALHIELAAEDKLVPSLEMSNGLSAFSTTFVSHQAEDVSTGVTKFLSTNPADCLVLIPHHYGFLRRAVS